MNKKIEVENTKIENLSPRMSNVNVIFLVIDKTEPRKIVSRRNGRTDYICDALVGDETGTVIISLWNDTIDQFEVGKTYRVRNCYTGTYREELRLKIGRYSVIEESDHLIKHVNMDANVSPVTGSKYTNLDQDYFVGRMGYDLYASTGSQRKGGRY